MFEKKIDDAFGARGVFINKRNLLNLDNLTRTVKITWKN